MGILRRATNKSNGSLPAQHRNLAKDLCATSRNIRPDIYENADKKMPLMPYDAMNINDIKRKIIHHMIFSAMSCPDLDISGHWSRRELDSYWNHTPINCGVLFATKPLPWIESGSNEVLHSKTECCIVSGKNSLAGEISRTSSNQRNCGNTTWRSWSNHNTNTIQDIQDMDRTW